MERKKTMRNGNLIHALLGSSGKKPNTCKSQISPTFMPLTSSAHESSGRNAHLLVQMGRPIFGRAETWRTIPCVSPTKTVSSA